MRLFAVRLTEGDRLKESIERIVSENQFTAATIVSAVGSLSQVVMRMAGASPESQDIQTYTGVYEIVSLIGNLGQGRTHLHMAISDSDGGVTGGHLKEGAIVHTTVELVLAVDDRLAFSEEVDEKTGFGELKISELVVKE